MTRKRKINQAILLFTHTPEQEAKKKPLSGSLSREADRKIAAQLIERSCRIAEKTAADLVIYDSARQQGNSFAERFTRAFHDLFEEGYNQILAIGNDTPELSQHHLKWALEQLKDHKAVLGPSLDGGVYLIGLSCEMFQADSFLQIPWETSQVYASLSGWLAGSFDIHHLEPLRDLDTERDLRLFLKRRPSSQVLRHLIQRIISIVASTGSVLSLYLKPIPSLFSVKTDSPRAPPYFID